MLWQLGKSAALNSYTANEKWEKEWLYTGRDTLALPSAYPAMRGIKRALKKPSKFNTINIVNVQKRLYDEENDDYY